MCKLMGNKYFYVQYKVYWTVFIICSTKKINYRDYDNYTIMAVKKNKPLKIL